MTVFIVYKTDVWHTHASKVFLGVGTSLEEGIKICKKQARKEGKRISTDQLELLSRVSQTQGYHGAWEFYMEEWETNILY